MIVKNDDSEAPFTRRHARHVREVACSHIIKSRYLQVTEYLSKVFARLNVESKCVIWRMFALHICIVGSSFHVDSLNVSLYLHYHLT